MNQTAQDYLLSIPVWTRKKNTLAQVRDFLEAMGNPDRSLSVIHVAGTNGKGSVCAGLTGIFLDSGYRVGTFVSPHLIQIRERFLINGEPVPEEAFERSFQTVYSVWDKLKEKGYCHPTFFEYLFLMAMDLFAASDLDLVILETGLGGRLDTTNVIEKPLAAVITSIGLDHTQYLGTTVAQIAQEKAGIIKPGVPVVFDSHDKEASAVILRHARKAGVMPYPVDGAYGGVQFAAPYLARNAALSVCTARVLAWEGVTEQTINSGLKRILWQGRMEEAAPEVWLDGAHNPDGVRALIEAVHRMQKADPKNLQLLFAAVGDKDYNRMIQSLCRELPFTSVAATRLCNDRSLSPEELKQAFLQCGCASVSGFESTKEALFYALAHKTEEDRLIVAGSLYLIGEIKEHLRRKEDAGL